MSVYYTYADLVSYQQILWEGMFTALPSSLPLTEREIVHLNDVRSLIRGAGIFGGVCVLTLFSMLFSYSVRTYARSRTFRLHLTGGMAGGIVLVVSSALFSFNAVFIGLHRIFFQNEFWLLPQDALLINMYPPAYFFDQLFVTLTLGLVYYILIITISKVTATIYDTAFRS